MSLQIGIVGLPNVGKSSLFSALTNSEVLIANYPFATIEPNIGIVNYLDERVIKLSELVKPQKTIYSYVQFSDIAGLVKGASQGAGLGNKFLSHIKTTDLICCVIRCFHNEDILSVNKIIDPIEDAQIIVWELIYSDIELINKIIKKLKSNNPRIPLLNKLREFLEKGQLLSSLDISENDLKIVKEYQFLTIKPLFFIGNINDNESHKDLLNKLKEYANNLNKEVIPLNINNELEISKLSLEDQKEYLNLLGCKSSGISQIVALSMKKLNLNSFFTIGKEEVRSWNFIKGWTAKECAGVIHTDLKDGFIKVKVIKYNDFIENPDTQKLQEEGKISVEGKDYLCEDGDILKIEFKN